MSVAEEVPRVSYDGDGSSTVFAYSFHLENDSELSVIVLSDDIETVLVLNSDYTVTSLWPSAGGSITLASGALCGVGDTLTIMRDISYDQQAEYVEGTTFHAASLEAALDRIVMQVQQLREENNRSVRAIRSRSAPALPTPEAGKYLQWDALDNLVNAAHTPTGAIPRFRVYDGGMQPFSYSGYKFTFSASMFDEMSDYDHVNHRFVAPVDGYYMFSANLYFTGILYQCIVRLFVNGAAYFGGMAIPSPAYSGYSLSDRTALLSDIIHLDAGDYVEVIGSYIAGSGVYATDRYFAGHLLSV